MNAQNETLEQILEAMRAASTQCAEFAARIEAAIESEAAKTEPHD